jgi:uncharacterized protein (TIGR02246 family)
VAEGVAVTFASLPEHGVKGRIEMKRLAVFAALILALGLVLAQDQDEEAIDGLRQEWADLFNEGDAEAIAELYTEDAIVYDAVGQVYEGRDAIQAYQQGNFDAGFTVSSFEALETEVLGDTAYAISRFTFATAAGESLGIYRMDILRRQDGQWRIHRLIANMIMPAQEMPEENGEDAN